MPLKDIVGMNRNLRRHSLISAVILWKVSHFLSLSMRDGYTSRYREVENLREELRDTLEAADAMNVCSGCTQYPHCILSNTSEHALIVKIVTAQRSPLEHHDINHKAPGLPEHERACIAQGPLQLLLEAAGPSGAVPQLLLAAPTVERDLGVENLTDEGDAVMEVPTHPQNLPTSAPL